MLELIIAILILFGIYFVAKTRGVKRAFISVVFSVPFSLILGSISIPASCFLPEGYWCTLNILTIIVSVVAGFFFLAFLPDSIFEPVSSFIAGSITMTLILVFILVFVSIPISEPIAIISIIFSGILAAYIGTRTNNSPSEKVKNNQKIKVKYKKENPAIQAFINGNHEAS